MRTAYLEPPFFDEPFFELLFFEPAFFELPFLVELFFVLLFLPPFLPPFLYGSLFSFWPRPEPLFLPPPLALLTVAHARRSASSSERPRFS